MGFTDQEAVKARLVTGRYLILLINLSSIFSPCYSGFDLNGYCSSENLRENKLNYNSGGCVFFPNVVNGEEQLVAFG